MLQPEVPGFDKTPHANLSFHMLMNGLLSKLLAETPAAKLDRELANKIMFAQFLVSMSFNYTHKQVLDTCQEMIMAWQMKEFEWSDWSLINSRLKSIRSRYQQVPQPHVGPRTKDPKSPQPGGGGGGFPPADKKTGKLDVNGVLKSYMRTESICINYNSQTTNNTGCKEKASHKAPYKDAVLKHICGGCYAKSGAEKAHPVSKCNKGPFAQLFR